jgi:hypothetical protein
MIHHHARILLGSAGTHGCPGLADNSSQRFAGPSGAPAFHRERTAKPIQVATNDGLPVRGDLASRRTILASLREPLSRGIGHFRQVLAVAPFLAHLRPIRIADRHSARDDCFHYAAQAIRVVVARRRIRSGRAGYVCAGTSHALDSGPAVDTKTASDIAHNALHKRRLPVHRRPVPARLSERETGEHRFLGTPGSSLSTESRHAPVGQFGERLTGAAIRIDG